MDYRTALSLALCVIALLPLQGGIGQYDSIDGVSR